MSRFQKVRGYDRNPRSRDSVISSICSAQRIYLETGGEDIDFGIRSARATLKMYHEQCEGQPHPGVEPITHAQADRARAQLTSLTRQRERKLEQIHAMVEEMYAYTDQFCAEESVEGNAERNADLRPAETPVTNEEKESCGETSVSTELRADQSPAAGPGRKSALRSALRSV
ncbi:MAG: hypothetical protein M5U25_16075 [Planctomycetota bacterium]|nr:hypothetical protein [Planctomycetota bacterium]